MNSSLEKKLLAVARESIAAYLDDKSYRPAFSFDEKAAHGVFVTLWQPEKSGSLQLRGCIGRHHRQYPEDLAQEVADCAIAAATEDPRFPPVEKEELAHLQLEITLLGKPEVVSGPDALNPKIFGAIMLAADGRQSTLLPEIEGIDTVDAQLSVLRRKAGIGSHEPVTLFRFTGRKLSDERELI